MPPLCPGFLCQAALGQFLPVCDLVEGEEGGVEPRALVGILFSDLLLWLWSLWLSRWVA